MLRRAGFDLEESAMLTPSVVAAEFFARKRYRRVLVLGVQGVSQPLIDAGVAVVRPGDDEADIDATFVGWHPEFALRDIEAACRVAWAAPSCRNSRRRDRSIHEGHEVTRSRKDYGSSSCN